MLRTFVKSNDCSENLFRSCWLFFLLGSSRDFCGFFVGSGSFFGNKRSWFADVCDNDLRAVGRCHAFWEGDFTDAQGVTIVESRDIVLKLFGKVFREAGDLDGVSILLKDTTGFDTHGLTNEVDRDIGSDLGFVIHGEEIDVKGVSGQRIVLDCFEEDRACALSFYIQVDENTVG